MESLGKEFSKIFIDGFIKTTTELNKGEKKFTLSQLEKSKEKYIEDFEEYFMKSVKEVKVKKTSKNKKQLEENEMCLYIKKKGKNSGTKCGKKVHGDTCYCTLHLDKGDNEKNTKEISNDNKKSKSVNEEDEEKKKKEEEDDDDDNSTDEKNFTYEEADSD